MAIGNLLKPEAIPLGAKVARNVIYNAARSIILAPLPFLLIPYFLKKLGPAGYGTWAVFLAINGMTSLADLGLVTSISKHVAQYYALKDFRALGQLISTGIALYFAIAGTLAAGLWMSGPVLISALFRNGTISSTELMTLWKYLILLAVANILTLLFSSVAIGLQRLDLTTGMNSVNLLLSAGISVAFLHEGLGLRGILYGYLIAAWIVTLLYAYVVHHLLPDVHLGVASCRTGVAREILGFSAKAYVTQIAVVVHNQIEKFYLARMVGVVPVGWYDVSSDLALKLRGIPGLILAPIMPAASELDARNDQRSMMDLYLRAHKYLAFIGIPLVVYTTLVSRRLVELWVGPSLLVISVPLCLLLITNFINLTTGPGFLILMGRGNLRPGLYTALLGFVLNLTLSYFFIRAYGFQGAVIGTSLSLCCAAVFFHSRFHCETNSSWGQLAKIAYLKPLFGSLLAAGGMFLFLPSRVSWFGLLAVALVFGLTYSLLLLLFRFFDTVDLALAESFVTVPSIIRRLVPNTRVNSSLLYNGNGVQSASD